MKISREKLVYVCSLFISLFYAYGMSSLPNEIFRDRINYVGYAVKSENLLSNYTGLSFFTNEPIFLLFNKLMAFFFEPELVPKVFVFFITFSISFFVFYKCKNLALGFLSFIAILVVPQIFHLELVVIRQGAAACFLLWITYYFWNSKYYLLFVFIIGFIHSSTFIVFSFLLIDKIFSSFVSAKIYYRVLIISLLSVGIAILLLPAAELLSMRQAQEYSEQELNVGGGNFILYAFVLVIMLTQSQKVLQSDGISIVAIIGISIYLGMYFFSPLSGRLIVTFIPFVIFAISGFSNKRSYALLFFYIFINASVFLPTVINNSLTLSGVAYLNSL